MCHGAVSTFSFLTELFSQKLFHATNIQAETCIYKVLLPSIKPPYKIVLFMEMEDTFMRLP